MSLQGGVIPAKLMAFIDPLCGLQPDFCCGSGLVSVLPTVTAQTTALCNEIMLLRRVVNQTAMTSAP